MSFVRFKSYTLFLIAAFLIPACSIWDNFTTYFNLYYNTTDIFEEVELQINAQKKNLFSSEEMTLPGSVNTQLIKVVEKCSEILQFHPESGYVDDALLMLGKAFYYQKNYQKSLRKFEELLTAQTESDLIPETRLWIGKTLLRLKNYEEGLSILEEIRQRAIEEDREDLIKDAFVEEIIYRITQKEYLPAITLTNQYLEVTDDNAVKAEVYYELGKLYNLTNEPQNAVAAFEKVFEFNPDYEIELQTNLEFGMTLREIGEKEKALNLFEDMRDEAKFNDSYNLIDLQTGITLHELGRLEEAVEKLIFTDTTYRNTPSSAIAKYRLGEIFENDYKNFDSASSYYQKSLTSALPKEYMTEVTQKIRVFKKYQSLSSLVNNAKNQLFYLENPEEYIKDSVKFVQDSALYVQDSLEVLEELLLYSEHLKFLAGMDLDTSVKDTASSLDSLTVADSLALIDSLKDSSVVLDSARIDSIRQKERELAFKREIAKKGVNIDSLFAEKWDPERKFPKKPYKSNLSEDSLKSILVKNQIDLGNLFLTEMELYDSAYYYYNYIMTYYPHTSHHATALYALGSYYLSVDEKEKADSLFSIIYENYKTESIVNAAADKLNKPLIDFEYDPAKNLYEEAEVEMLQENYTSSLNKFYSIYRKYPGSPVAPKALFASGWILENALKLNDSAAVVYDTLAVHYPQSEFSVKVRPKLTVYKQYRKHVEDSLKRIEDEKLLLLASDSLGTTDSLKTGETAEVQYPGDKKEDVVRLPDTKLPADTIHAVILNDPRRNLRRK